MAMKAAAFKSKPSNRKDAAKFRAGVSSTPQMALSQQRTPTRLKGSPQNSEKIVLQGLPH
ncbi:Uncharacterized protein AC516_0217 [Pseudomonas amygdali pv. sesami]|nr:Uncharacterized protein AC516_0217 [Pseudomonas amygdali pv. sesami]